MQQSMPVGRVALSGALLPARRPNLLVSLLQLGDSIQEALIKVFVAIHHFAKRAQLQAVAPQPVLNLALDDAAGRGGGAGGAAGRARRA